MGEWGSVKVRSHPCTIENSQGLRQEELVSINSKDGGGGGVQIVAGICSFTNDFEMQR